MSIRLDASSRVVVGTDEARRIMHCPDLPRYTGQTLHPQDLFLMAPDDPLPEKSRTAYRGFCYGHTPQEAYDGRVRAYDEADLCLSIHEQTVQRLLLLHPRVAGLPPKELMRFCRELSFSEHAHSCPALPHFDIPRTLVFVVHHFSVGGLERVVLDLMRAAQESGANPVLMHDSGIVPESARELETMGIESHRLPEAFEGRIALLKRLDAAAVNAHYATLLYRECHELSIPFIQTIHNMYIWLRGAAAEEWRRMNAHTTAYIAVSANAARVTDRLGLDISKMIVIPNGSRFCASADLQPDDGTNAALRKELGLPEGSTVFTNVASILPAKGQLLFVHALARALQKKDDIYIILLGKILDQTYAALLLETIDRLGIGKHILMLGFRDDVPAILNLSTAAIFPSYYEGWSLAISEALSLGMPVIATDVGGAAEQLRGVSGSVLLPSPLAYGPDGEIDLQALTDMQHQEKACAPLTAAMLDAARTPPLKEARPPCVMDADSVMRKHLDVVGGIISGKPVSAYRSACYLVQRQNADSCISAHPVDNRLR